MVKSGLICWKITFFLSNIFLFQNTQKRQVSIKIGDLGNSKKIEDSLNSTVVGTPYYFSPEIISKGMADYSNKSDVW